MVYIIRYYRKNDIWWLQLVISANIANPNCLFTAKKDDCILTSLYQRRFIATTFTRKQDLHFNRHFHQDINDYLYSYSSQ